MTVPKTLWGLQGIQEPFGLRLCWDPKGTQNRVYQALQFQTCSSFGLLQAIPQTSYFG